MKKCIVIGGGFAGLSAAAYLIKNNVQVEIIEASSKLGGRAFSLQDDKTGDFIDNGQHILLGCYKDTLEFLKIINATDNFNFQSNLEINFLRESSREFPLKAVNLPYPLNLLFGFLNYKALSLKERLQIIQFFIRLYFYSDSFLEKITINDWLNLEEQGDNTKKCFWEIVSIAALNCGTNLASAQIFSSILKKIFFKGKKAATIILPKFDLSKSFCDSTKTYVEENDSQISFSESLEEFVFTSDKLESIVTNKRVIKDFNYVISALPLNAIKKALKENDFLRDLNLDYSSILNIHLWYEDNPLEHDFYGFIGSAIHWVFNKGTHITVTISDANKYESLDKEEIMKIVLEEIEKYLKLSKNKIKHFRVIREKRATFVPTRNIINNRPESATRWKNFFLAGDWTNTGLPSTIEGAVKSGKKASLNVLKTL